jgi:hypothetical protein
VRSAADRGPTTYLALVAAVLLSGAAITGCGSDRPTTRPVSSVLPPVPKHKCGTLPGPGATFSILTGSVGCAEARRVFSDLFAGRGTPETSPDTRVDGWLCSGGAGGFGCGKNGQLIAAAASP